MSRGEAPPNARPAGVGRVVEEIVDVVPPAVRLSLIGLALAAFGLGAHALVSTVRGRRLRSQRERLLEDVGLLQATLLPAIPPRLGELASSVAYQPADGPAAGGDFYDAFCFGDGRVGVVVGDISGHGRQALSRTAHLRYTLRTYLEMGLEPRAALKAGARAVDGDLEDALATVVLGVFEPHTRALSYAAAGHPPPIVVGPDAYEPVTVAASPPIGAGLATGLRQTTCALHAGSTACFYTDGVADVRIGDGTLGREGLSQMLVALGRGASAQRLLEGLSTTADRVTDDMALCMIRADAAAEGGPRVEELEVSLDDVTVGRAERFLRACDVPQPDIADAVEAAGDATAEREFAVLRVRISPGGASVEVASDPPETVTMHAMPAGVAA